MRTIIANNERIIENGVKIIGHNNEVIGNNNKVIGNNNKVIGNNNEMSGSNNGVKGNSNSCITKGAVFNNTFGNVGCFQQSSNGQGFVINNIYTSGNGNKFSNNIVSDIVYHADVGHENHIISGNREEKSETVKLGSRTIRLINFKCKNYEREVDDVKCNYDDVSIKFGPRGFYYDDKHIDESVFDEDSYEWGEFVQIAKSIINSM